MKKETFAIVGMHCASCKKVIEMALGEKKAVKSVNVNFSTETLLIEYDDSALNFNEIAKIVGSVGNYKLVKDDSEKTTANQKAHKKLSRKLLVVGIALIPFALMMVGMILQAFGLFEMGHAPLGMFAVGGVEINLFFVVQFVLASVILFYGGSGFYTGTFNALKSGNFNMDTLVALGTTTAWLFSSVVTFLPWVFADIQQDVFFEAAAFIVFFILLGRFFESKAKSKANDAIKKLFQLQAKEATVLKDGKEVKVSVDKLAVGDIVVVRSGEKIALDGEIIEGNASIDEAAVTGESIPIEKSVGDKVIGATVNKSGAIKFKVEKIGKDTLLSQIIKMVEEAQGTRAPIQKLADQISGIFVPIVIIIAVSGFVFWQFFATGLGISLPGNVISTSIYIATAVLIIACPCALGLATPTAVMVGTGKAARHGILIKNAESLEHAHQIDAIVFDKTGTLTEGKPVVDEIICESSADAKKWLTAAAALEHLSEHPLSEAITRKADEDSLDYLDIKTEDFKMHEGMGVSGKIDGQPLVIGNDKLMSKFKIEANKGLNERAAALNGEGKTVVSMAAGGKLIALFALFDKPKKEAKEAVRALHKKGIEVVMLTGDHKDTASFIADKLGIDRVIAEVLPTEKTEQIKKLKAEGLFVAMVGDGINDAPALAEANIGIAMGTGTDIAKEAGDMVLVHGTVDKVVEAIEISNRTLRVIKQNLVWAFGYNVIAIPVAAGVLYPFFGILLSPIIASAAMAFSSVSVVLNSLRLKRG
ncbi:heavy metal translocating P-type ATPase [Candidatus Peregrinibacteria bacterium]|nr:heavy metal translocating P-type ATPase [Candidatus Peregrinibacteria bacterium]